MDLSNIFTELEQEAELLIETCKHLKQENRRLEQHVATLSAECSELKKRNALIAEKISTVIHQLKTVDAAAHAIDEVEAYER